MKVSEVSGSARRYQGAVSKPKRWRKLAAFASSVMMVCTLSITVPVASAKVHLRGISEDRYDDLSDRHLTDERRRTPRERRRSKRGMMRMMRRPIVTPPSSEEESDEYFESSGIFDIRLPLFTSQIGRGHVDEDDVRADLDLIGKYALNNIVSLNLGEVGFGNPLVRPAVEFGPPIAVGAPEGADGAPQRQPVDETVTDFETNNQEEGVDEADLLKSDGVYVYGAYGDVLVVWDTEGAFITSLQMEPLDTTRSSFFYGGSPLIQDLLLYENRLAVILGGFGPLRAAELDRPPVLTDYLNTQIRLYDTSNLPNSAELVLISVREVNGSYRDARTINGIAYVVSFSGMDVYQYLDQPAGRGQPIFEGLSDALYEEAVRSYAEDELLPTFRDALFDDLSAGGGLPSMFRVCLWQTDVAEASNVPRWVYDNIANSFAQVASFNMTEDTTDVSLSGSFMPTYGGEVYASEDMIVIAATAYDWIPIQRFSRETTYLLGIAIEEGTSTSTAAVGSVEGSILNRFSVDVFDGFMRIATTSRGEFFLEDDEGRSQPSSTQNLIVVMEIPSVNDPEETPAFEEVGRLVLGLVNEVFTAVRFFDVYSFAVTFERTDPYYVLDLTNPFNPEEVGQLSDITGFSSYLHPINVNNTLMLAVGQDATPEGVVLGLQIALFNSTDPTNPSLLQNYVLEDSMSQWSSSSIVWDQHAFRYLPLGEDYGRLIIPVSVSGVDFFDGFIVFVVSPDEITPVFNITHGDNNYEFGPPFVDPGEEPAFLPPPYCYSCASFPERSFVFRGDVMTIKGHSVLSHNMTDGSLEWRLDVDEYIESESCCGYVYAA